MRAELGEYIRRITTVPLPAAPNVPIIDYEVQFLVLNSNLLFLSEFYGQNLIISGNINY